MNAPMRRRLSSQLPVAAGMAFAAVLLIEGSAFCQTAGTVASDSWDSARRMVILYHADPAFIEGLRRHDLLRDYGFRLHNTGLIRQPFGDRWRTNPLLDEARRSGRWYYIDHIAGGMPFQSLEGIESVARRLKDDPHFLGFQFHEWVNAAIHDHRRVRELLLDKGLPFDRPHFAEYEARVDAPFFGGGDFAIYDGVFRPIQTRQDVERYLRDYFLRMSGLTSGQLMAVNGYYQFYHTALELGARNVMAEIGNQVPLTALQIACVRGAARQFGRPFGVYYEPWGGSPFGCPCALGWSPWFPGGGNPDQKVMGYRIRPELGSSRSLHRRLMYYAWLSGVNWWSEEWGPENYFSDWKDYPLTDYGRVMQEFLRVTGPYGKPRPIVPAAIILPPGTAGIDLRYAGRYTDLLYEQFPADEIHVRVRHFAEKVLGARPLRRGLDDYNLTPSPWIGCFDVLSAGAAPAVLEQYGILIRLDNSPETMPAASSQGATRYRGTDADASACIDMLKKSLPLRVEGEVGSALARLDGAGIMVGLFNNLGVAKRDGKETADPNAARRAAVFGPVDRPRYLVGGQFVTRQDAGAVEVLLPAGEVAILLVPDDASTRVAD